MPLRQVFPDPRSEDSSGKTANIDIIAVHGLNFRSRDAAAHAWDTWRSPAGENGHLWLRDDLPKHIPLARIFLYEYDATAVYGNDRSTFSDKANNLLEAIQMKREGVESRRILFLGHSMGGLLIKQALINAHSDVEYKSIQEATTGLAFFATPQFGGSSGLVNLANTTAKIASSVGFKKGDNVIQTLKKGSIFSGLMQEHFRHQLPHYNIVSFWGSEDDIVPRDSTRFGLSGDHEKIITLTASHGGVCKFGEGQTDQDNLELVTSNIVKLYKKALENGPKSLIRQAGQPCQPCQPYYYIPFHENKSFVGRDEILKTLKQKLFVQKTSRIVAVFGLGGVGKTQVALQMAYWAKKNKTEYSVFWISALSEESFNFACMGIAKKLSIRKSAADEEPKEMVRRYLSSEAAGKWLLVVDNADDWDQIFGSHNAPGGVRIFDFLPDSEHGLTLFTTRSAEVASEVARFDIIDLQEMSSKEGIAMLQKSLLVHEDESLMMELLVKLTFLPLAITQAAAYLNKKKVPISKYLELLDGTEQDLVGLMSKEFRDNTRYRDSQNAIATTWLVSFEQVRKSDKAAADLLLFISCIEPRRIPLSLLPCPEPSQQQQDALGTLCAYAFLTRQVDKEEFDMHRLVHLAARVWADKKGLMTESIGTAIRHLAAIFRKNNFSDRDLWKAYLPHLLQVLQQSNGLAMEERSDLYFRAGLFLEADGRIKEAVSCLEKRHCWTKEHLPEDDPSRLTSGHNLGRAYLDNGQIKKAIELLEHVVKCREITLAEDDTDRLMSQHELGRAYQRDKQFEKSTELLEYVLVLQKGNPVKNKDAILWSQHELGRTYLAQKQREKAIKLLEQTLNARKKALVEDDEATLWSRHELGKAYLDNWQRKKAIKQLEHVVSIRERTLEENHAALLWSQHELARGYRDDRQTKRAIKLLEHVTTVRKSLVENDPARLWSEHELARTYTDDGQVEKAIKLLEHVVAIRKALPADDADRLFSEEELSRAYRKQAYSERDNHECICM